MYFVEIFMTASQRGLGDATASNAASMRQLAAVACWWSGEKRTMPGRASIRFLFFFALAKAQQTLNQKTNK